MSKLPGKKIWHYPLFLYQLIISLYKSFRVLKNYRPYKIISTGGLIAIPVCLAGTLLSIPIELYELNVKPGKAIRFLSFFARDIFLTFQASKNFFYKKHRSKCKVKNYPLRFCQDDKTCNKQKLIETINNLTKSPIRFTTNLKTIFVLGGSKGSLFLNNLIKQWLVEHKKAPLHMVPFQIIHQTGFVDTSDWQAFYNKHSIPAYPFSYTESIKNFYLLADLIICRAGAGTLFELEFFQKPSIIIPLKNQALNHQVENAREMAKRYPDLFVVYDQDSIKKNFDIFEKQINLVISTPLIKSSLSLQMLN